MTLEALPTAPAFSFERLLYRLSGDLFLVFGLFALQQAFA
jgi:hypothetical protein